MRNSPTKYIDSSDLFIILLLFSVITIIFVIYKCIHEIKHISEVFGVESIL